MKVIDLNKKQKSISEPPNIKAMYQIFVAFILYLVSIVYTFPNFIQTVKIPSVGEVSPSTFILKQSITYENVVETEKIKKSALDTIKPSFDMPKDIAKNTIERVNNVFAFIRIAADNDMNKDDSYQTFLSKYSMAVNKVSFFNILEYNIHINFEEKIIELLREFFQSGVLSRYTLNPKTLELLERNGALIYKFDDYTIEEAIYPPRRMYFNEDLREDMHSIVSFKYPELKSDEADTLSVFVNAFLEDNVFFSSTRTEEVISDTISKIKPVYNTIKKGYVVLEVGDTVTQEDAELMKYAYGNFNLYNILKFIGNSLFILLIFFFMGFIVRYYQINFYYDMKKYTLVAIEYVLIITIAYFSYNYWFNAEKVLYLPFYVYTFIPLFSMMNVMLGAKKSISTALTMSFILIAAIITNGTITEVAILFITSMIASIMSKRISNRSSILLLGLYIGISFSICYLLSVFVHEGSKVSYIALIVSFFSGLIQSLLLMLLLPLCESILSIATIFRLQELSDLNNPLLRQLQLQAPGTYHHSISMGSLVESIAEELGENARLACVSAYYHDIGKMENPLYFIENTTRKDSRHLNLKPTLSATIVKSHVRIGVEIAKKYKLPDEIIDAIKEHHGQSIIRYFYVQALKEQPNVDKELFTYPGPKPRSKITAIIMLLDSIEAASRTLEAPKKEDIENLIKVIINDKIVQGDLVESGLTLKDIAIIQKVAFQKIMVSLHERIAYPEIPQTANNNENASNSHDKKR